MSTPDPTKTLAFVVHEVRLLLAGHLGSGAHGDPPVRAAAHLAYALHNQALAVMKDGSFDGETAEAAIARVDEMLGESFSRRLSEAIRATGSSGHASEHTMLNRIHHAAIICSDYPTSKRFYTEVLGLKVIAEHFREARNSWKLDLGLPDGSQVELFSFPGAPPRPSYPEAQGLRHLAFVVDDVAASKAQLEAQGVAVEPVRVDEYTGRRFTFFSDPDGLPLELYEA
jgi:glyoxylase I family protein